MFSNESGIITDEGKLIFTNRFAMQEYVELQSKLIVHMLSDLAQITGLDKQSILNDYLILNSYSPIKEVLKKEGKYTEEKSLVLITCGK